MALQPTTNQIYAILDQVMDPELNHSLVELGMIRDIDIDDGRVHVELQLTTPHCPFAENIVQQMKDAVAAVPGVQKVEVERACMKED